MNLGILFVCLFLSGTFGVLMVLQFIGIFLKGEMLYAHYEHHMKYAKVWNNLSYKADVKMFEVLEELDKIKNAYTWMPEDKKRDMISSYEKLLKDYSKMKDVADIKYNSQETDRLKYKYRYEKFTSSFRYRVMLVFKKKFPKVFVSCLAK